MATLSPALLSAAAVAVRDCMGAQPGERVLVITDEPQRLIGLALHRAARELGLDVLLVEMIARQTNGEEPPTEVAELMTRFDVAMCATLKSLTHTEARRAASAAGTRVATLPGVTEEIMVRCMNADYDRIARRTHHLCDLLAAASTIRVQAAGGTDVLLPIEGRQAFASSGIFRERGQWGNLPTGEAYLAPVEGRSQGVVVVDGSMAGVGLVRTPIRITIEDGYATTISGGVEADRLRALLDAHGREARTVAEFGIGTNDRARLTGVILEDEKVMGTIHIAFGDNKSMGGSVRVASHLDGLVTAPTVHFDDRLIMDRGQFASGIEA
jgi:aminopeptidase